MGSEIWRNGRHFNNVSDEARTGNCGEELPACHGPLAVPIVNIGWSQGVLI